MILKQGAGNDASPHNGAVFHGYGGRRIYQGSDLDSINKGYIAGAKDTEVVLVAVLTVKGAVKGNFPADHNRAGAVVSPLDSQIAVNKEKPVQAKAAAPGLGTGIIIIGILRYQARSISGKGGVANRRSRD